MKWIKYCNSFSLLDHWGKMWTFRALPWGVSDGTCPLWLVFGVLSVWWNTSASISTLFRAILTHRQCSNLPNNIKESMYLYHWTPQPLKYLFLSVGERKTDE